MNLGTEHASLNKKKSSSRSYIFHCSEEWKYKFYIFTSGNITFLKYAFYCINNSLYFITLYIIKVYIFQVRPMNSYFGSVLCSTDVNADGYDDILIGAPTLADKLESDVGAVFLYLGISVQVVHA